MPKDYKVHKVWIDEVDFEVLVLEIPEADLEDKLAYLARDKGNITRSFYLDFVIATCIANVNQLLYHIKQKPPGTFDLSKIREELLEKILRINKALDPGNLIINRNFVIKLKNNKKLRDGERILSDNKSWMISMYDDVYDEPPVFEGPPDEPKKQLPNELKKPEELNFEVVKQWWRRINKYVEIKKFKEEDMYSILGQKFFHDHASFQTYIVTMCVVDAEDLFQLLDNLGVTANTSPPTLMLEVYKLCKEANPFLTYDNARMLFDEEVSEQPSCPVNNQGTNRMTSHARQQSQKKKKSKKTFKDVPKDELLSLDNRMKVFVIGQDQAIDQIVEAIQRASVGLKDPMKPIGSFMFAGRTGIGKCVEKGSLTFSEQGIIPIENFASDKKIDELEVDLYGIDGPNKTSHIYREGTKPGRRIITDNGYTLGGSLVHPVVVINDEGNLEFKKFHELTTDDFVAIQYNQNYFSETNAELHFEFTGGANAIQYDVPTEMSEELAYYIGLLIGDGGLSVKKQIYFTNKDKQLIRSFYMLSEKLFGIVPKDNYTGDYVYGYGSVQIREFFEKACGVSMTLSKHKTIPESILRSKKECVASFIRGLMDTDGCFEKSGAVALTSASEILIRQLQTVLLNFGIISSVRHRLVKYNDGFNDAWELSIRSRFLRNYMKEIGFSLNYKRDGFNAFANTHVYNPNKDVIPNVHEALHSLIKEYRFDRKFHRSYGAYYRGIRRPSRTKLNSILNTITNYVGKEVEEHIIFQHLRKLANTDIFWSKISNIEFVPEMELYDFTVPKTHTFTSNGFISHNTLASKVLADELIKDRNNLITIDCSEYSADHEYSKLIGASAGYVGYENGGVLTNALIENPFSVVVFDEVEKASVKVHELMLQILEEGRLTDNKGQKVSFKDAIIIMTSNIGVSEVDAVKKTIGFGDVAKLTEEKKNKAIDQAIKKKFKPEFLNRLDSIVHFNSLATKDYLRIIDLELNKLNGNLRENDTEYKELTLEFDAKVKNFILKHGIDEDFGARPLKRCIEKEISTPLALRLLRGDIDTNATIKITIKKERVAFVVTKNKEAMPPAKINEATNSG